MNLIPETQICEQMIRVCYFQTASRKCKSKLVKLFQALILNGLIQNSTNRMQYQQLYLFSGDYIHKNNKISSKNA